VCSDLNGNNGSWTNSDDVKKGGNPNAARRLAEKNEAAKNRNTFQHKATEGTNQKNVTYGPPEGSAPAKEEVPEKVLEAIVSNSWNNFAYVKGRWYVRKYVAGTAFYYDKDGNIPFPMEVAEGELVFGECESGVVTYDVNGPKCLATSAFARVVWPMRTYHGVNLNAEEFVILKPAYSFLLEKMPSNTRITRLRLETAVGTLVRQFGQVVPQQVLVDTAKSWFRSEHAIADQCLSTNLGRMIGECSVDVFDPQESDCTRHAGLNAVYFAPYKIEGIECEVPDNYEFKQTYHVKMIGGEICADWFGDNKVYPHFYKGKLPEERSKYYQSCYLSFSGKGGKFVYYDVSANNACKASQRLLAARENEWVKYTNQLELLYMLCEAGLINSAVVNTLRIRFVARKNCFGAIVGKHHTNYLTDGRVDEETHDVIFKNEFRTSLVQRHIVNHIGRYLQRINRSKLQEVVDTMHNASRWVYYQSYLQACVVMEPFIGRSIAGNIPHIKRQLRMDYVNGVQLHDDADTMVRRLKGHVKKEIAKVGKVPRIYVSYEAGCMYANELPEFYKMCVQHEMHFEKGSLHKRADVIIWVVSKYYDDTLDQVMRKLIGATVTPDTIYVCISSDDSCYGGNVDGHIIGLNVDIKSNDASCNGLGFSICGTALAHFNEARSVGLIKQCMMPITIDNPNDPGSKMVIKFDSAFEGSGTSLTRILNDGSNFSIAVAGLTYHSIFSCNFQLAVKEGAAIVGHDVTIDSWCDDDLPIYEKIQFLKRSPVMCTDGEWHAFLNYGCIFRSLGKVEGDMEPKQLGVSSQEFAALPIVDRMERFIGAVVRGHKHEPSTRILSALRERFCKGSTTITREFMASGVSITPYSSDEPSDQPSTLEAVEESFCRRYDITAVDVSELCDHIRLIQLGEDSVTEAVSRFYYVDYGLPCYPPAPVPTYNQVKNPNGHGG